MGCTDCKARCFPENPSQPFYMSGRYLPAICDSCSTREEEPVPQVVEHVVRHSSLSKGEADQIKRMTGELKYLRGLVNTKVDKREKKGDYY